MLTPADGFDVPETHRQQYDILEISVGTDPSYTLKMWRGTGYYKVPSLKRFGTAGLFYTTARWLSSTICSSPAACAPTTCPPAFEARA
jgi:hypothetical protein